MQRLIMASTAILLAAGGSAQAREQADPLPKAKDIQSVQIEYDHPQKDNVKFEATLEDWTAIRAALTPAKRDPNPAKWESLGTVVLKTKKGEPFNVYLYTTSKPPGAFSAGKSVMKRTYYRGGKTKKLLRALDNAYKKSQDE